VTKLPPYSFEGLKIRILDLSENSIDNLDQIFTKLDTDLKEINLNNAIVDYDVLKILGRFKNLTHLSLSHNEISARELPHKVFADLLDLEYLDLNGK
jgi:Leucine-rich repeat (LRR) protein